MIDQTSPDKAKDWYLRDLTINDCMHKLPRRMHCLIIQDVIRFFKKVEDKLQTHSPLFQRLKPRFILMGSVPEGTRIGVGNEMDICVQFQGLPPLHVNVKDPFHVYEPEFLPHWMTS